MRLKDKTVLITASTRGIGLACVKACAKEGASVYMAARNLELAKEEADKLNSQGCTVKCVYNDASRPESYITMTEEVFKDAGRIDVLINNFGTSNPGKDLDFSNTDTDVFLDTVNINLRSVFAASKEAVKYMAKQGSGSIVNFASMNTYCPLTRNFAYAMSKAAVANFTQSFAAYFAKTGIRVNAVAPGFIDTDMTKNMTEEAKKELNGMIPMGKMGNTKDIADLVMFLAGDSANYITGQVICVDGGMAI